VHRPPLVLIFHGRMRLKVCGADASRHLVASRHLAAAAAAATTISVFTTEVCCSMI
jgi:hypothetical protein